MASKVLFKPEVPEPLADLVVKGMGSVVPHSYKYRILRISGESVEISADLRLLNGKVARHRRRHIFSSGLAYDHRHRFCISVVKRIQVRCCQVNAFRVLVLLHLLFYYPVPIVYPKFNSLIIFMNIVDPADRKGYRPFIIIDLFHRDPRFG